MKPYAAWKNNKGWANQTEGSQSIFNDDGPGWMVCIAVVHGVECFVPMTFARKVDAEIAAKSIENIIDWNGSESEVAKRIKAYGLLNFRKRMTENLKW